MAVLKEQGPTPTKAWCDLYQLMRDHPNARIVTDEQSIAFNDGDWVDLFSVFYHEKENVIELTFSN